jgi:nucleotide-binding universal stress UspA family protein
MTELAEQTTSKYQTVLVATDFSETAGLALQRGAEVAARHGGRLVLVHAFNPQSMTIAMPAHVMVPTALDEKIREINEERLRRLAEGLEHERADLKVETRLILGEPGQSILDVAEETSAGLIVIGTRGLSGFEHLVLGSTAEVVVRRSLCPVLTIVPEAGGVSGDPLTVLVPCEVSEDPVPVAREVIRLLVGPAAGVRILLVYSDHLPAYLQPLIEDLGIDKVGFEQIEPELKDRLEPAAADLRELGCEVEIEILEGEPSSVIVETARRRGVDLIAMETRGHKGFAHLFLRSTAEKVVRHAGCPVLTMHRPSG